PQLARLTAQSLKVKIGVSEYVWFRIWGHFDGINSGSEGKWGQKKYRFAVAGRKSSRDGWFSSASNDLPLKAVRAS
ncbi:MAG: hypothetical protein LBE43_13400, partial [Staphylococcus aureus]|nr:hypothetical protein [Staphylococcus aureus]